MNVYGLHFLYGYQLSPTNCLGVCQSINDRDYSTLSYDIDDVQHLWISSFGLHKHKHTCVLTNKLYFMLIDRNLHYCSFFAIPSNHLGLFGYSLKFYLCP